MKTGFTKGRTIYVKESNWKLIKEYCAGKQLTIGYFIGDLIDNFLDGNRLK